MTDRSADLGQQSESSYCLRDWLCVYVCVVNVQCWISVCVHVCVWRLCVMFVGLSVAVQHV